MRHRIVTLAAIGLVLTVAAPAAARTHYVVRYGDTLTGIARAHGTSVRQLARMNHRRVNAILPAGTLLVVPGGGHPRARTYRVRWGDTLSGIAARYGVGVERLARANHLRPAGILRAGTTLHVFGAGRPSPLGGRYRVRPGDTLSGIAARYGIGIGRLARANGLHVHGILLAGITLRVPSGAFTPAPVATGPWSVVAAINAWSAHYGVDAQLARAVAWQESGFQIDILSPAGAWGPMQVIPSTWRYVERSLIGHRVAHTADGDVRVGVALLHHLVNAFGGSERLAVAAYYQGERSVRAGHILPFTRIYVADVLALRGRI
jgi:N-acetylmuramoyl-L-alanine amidase